MRFSTSAILIASAGMAFAQYSPMSTTTSVWAAGETDSASGCVQAVNAIVNQCLQTEQPKVDACADNDWTCYCQSQQQVLTCFNNCPSDSRAFGAQQQETQWCAAAKSYGSTSTTAKWATKTKAPTAVHNGAKHRTPQPATGTSSDENSDPNEDNAAFGMSAPLGGAFALALGAVALL